MACSHKRPIGTALLGLCTQIILGSACLLLREFDNQFVLISGAMGWEIMFVVLLCLVKGATLGC